MRRKWGYQLKQTLRQHAETQWRERTCALTQAGLLEIFFQMEAEVAQAHTDCQVPGNLFLENI